MKRASDPPRTAAPTAAEAASGTATDWDAYYTKRSPAAGFTRAVTARRLVAAMRRHGPARPVVVELGGGDSCVFERVSRQIRPREYHIVDNNRLALDLFRRRHGEPANVRLHEEDIFSFELPTPVDLVFSVGLIEHFDLQGTRQAIEAHFRPLEPGGVAIVTFPTPTWLYRVTRRLSEAAGTWIFHDERPLRLEEVRAAAEGRGTVLEKHIVWPTLLTQYHVAWRKNG